LAGGAFFALATGALAGFAGARLAAVTFVTRSFGALGFEARALGGFAATVADLAADLAA
jgi:hypothetical protein